MCSMKNKLAASNYLQQTVLRFGSFVTQRKHVRKDVFATVALFLHMLTEDLHVSARLKSFGGKMHLKYALRATIIPES